MSRFLFLLVCLSPYGVFGSGSEFDEIYPSAAAAAGSAPASDSSAGPAVGGAAAAVGLAGSDRSSADSSRLSDREEFLVKLVEDFSKKRGKNRESMDVLRGCIFNNKKITCDEIAWAATHARCPTHLAEGSEFGNISLYLVCLKEKMIESAGKSSLLNLARHKVFVQSVRTGAQKFRECTRTKRKDEARIEAYRAIVDSQRVRNPNPEKRGSVEQGSENQNPNKRPRTDSAQ